MEENIPNTTEWLSLVAKKLNIKEGHGKGEELAKSLSITRQTLYKQQRHNAVMSPEQAVRAAKILNISPIIIVSSCLHESAKNSEKEDDAILWKEIYLWNTGSNTINNP